MTKKTYIQPVMTVLQLQHHAPILVESLTVDSNLPEGEDITIEDPGSGPARARDFDGIDW
jgi:hypothetical protein